MTRDAPAARACRTDRRGRVAWAAVAVALGAAALLGSRLPVGSLDWQPARALAEPWRAVTAVGVHYSARHFGANLAGLVLTAGLGWVAAPPARIAAAWLAAWPLTQLGLLVEPQLAHYGGLSGVLHAGVAAIAVHLIATGTRAQRGVGAAIALGLAAKVLGEAPWGPPLRRPPQWDIAIAPLAHATGALAGAACAAGAGLAAAIAAGRARRAANLPCADRPA